MVFKIVKLNKQLSVGGCGGVTVGVHRIGENGVPAVADGIAVHNEGVVTCECPNRNLIIGRRPRPVSDPGGILVRTHKEVAFIHIHIM
ncbi:hypothetical protein SDC9_151595 [bioreactor metagenome]|uniref:Uncharacterized protein n=1 Tax=bioreactor metagenome TaxID=1076179 RepID=A0A645EQQ9_9ZZZZ